MSAIAKARAGRATARSNRRRVRPGELKGRQTTRELFASGIHPYGGEQFCRVIRHEDHAEREAVPRWVKLYEARVERLNALLDRDVLTGAGFRAHVQDETYGLERIRTPQRRGQCDKHLILVNDLPSVIGYTNSHLSIVRDCDTDTGMAQTVLAHLREVRAQIGTMIKTLEADLAENPDQWQPLPTLGEFMAKGGAL